MALTAATVTDRARSTLLDQSGVSWTDSELVSYINGAMTQIVALKPDALPKRITITLVSGAPQTIPSDGVLFMGAPVNSAGGSVTMHSFEEFVRVHPTWGADTAGAPRCVLFDPRLPTGFYVYPRALAGDTLVIWYGALPDRVASTGGTIDLPDYYETALWAYVCALAYAKNSKRQDFAKSDEMMKLFMQSVAGVTPPQHALGARPDVKGVR